MASPNRHRKNLSDEVKGAGCWANDCTSGNNSLTPGFPDTAEERSLHDHHHEEEEQTGPRDLGVSSALSTPTANRNRDQNGPNTHGSVSSHDMDSSPSAAEEARGVDPWHTCNGIPRAGSFGFCQYCRFSMTRDAPRSPHWTSGFNSAGDRVNDSHTPTSADRITEAGEGRSYFPVAPDQGTRMQASEVQRGGEREEQALGGSNEPQQEQGERRESQGGQTDTGSLDVQPPSERSGIGSQG
ncbi:hypothetical protein K402DRAFT_462607 [Aulographum hederae CBS 113979]|uniref:Uncharacterized protein n=1 Tax=Aulographum hederae CBS 113979 TaxID=1176131 RepID=A0A6G1H3T9_9PEZI|nr:hypothetical protein K402DRAFT_462607 [Aulographum hederae CBS 113979]